MTMQDQTKAAAALPDYVMADERTIAALIVAELIADGYRLSVFDGEEWTVRRSNDAREVAAALATTDSDALVATDQDGAQAGAVSLIWGNGNALLSDWSMRLGAAGAGFGMAMERIADEIERRYM